MRLTPHLPLVLSILALDLLVIQPAQAQFFTTGSLKDPCNTHTQTLLANGEVLVAGGSTGADSAEIYNPANATWTVTAPMNVVRDNPSATLLQNGDVLVAGGFGGSSITSSSELYNPSTGAWTATGNLITARANQTATLLSNGLVLVAGGLDTNNNVLFSAELYDPITGAWAATGSMNNAREYHTATLLANGQVLVTGGSDNFVITNSAELYDPITGIWTLTGAMHLERADHTATLLPGGQVLVAGGADGFSDVLIDAELYDPTNGAWTETGTLNTARWGHTANLLPNGQVLVAGGLADTGDPTNSAELYDPVAGAWTPTFNLNIARYGQTATLLVTGAVLLAGGVDTNFNILSSAELFTGTWTLTSPMNTVRLNQTETLLPNGLVLVAGGYVNSVDITNSAELYNPTNGYWTPTGSMITARAGHTATLLANGEVLVAGGFQRPANSAELYNPTNGTWIATGSMNVGRFYHTATLLADGQVLVAGGDVTNVNNTIDVTNTAELYNPILGTWTLTGPMTTNREGFTATLLPNGTVLVAGGDAGTYEIDNIVFTILLASAEFYHPSQGTWAPTGPMAIPHDNHTATLLPNGQVLVAGGWGEYGSGDVFPIAASELYDPASGTWTSTGAMNDARYYHTANLLPNGEVLVAGGNDYPSPDFTDSVVPSAEVYDPGRETWTRTGSLNVPRYYHTAVTLPNGQVLVAGGAGVDSVLSPAELYVNVADLFPHNIDQFVDTNVFPGSNVTFTVFAVGAAPLSYQWLFDGSVISNATDASLTIANAQPANTGNYEVVLSNAFGAVTSAVATLSVSNIFVLPTSQFDITAPTNSINLQADTAGSTADTTYAWSKTSGEDQIIFTDPSSANTGVLFGFTGTYQLSVTATTGTNVLQTDVTVNVDSYTNEFFGNETDGFFENISNFVNGPLLTNANVFLTRFLSTNSDAINYYAAIDPQNTKTTLADWKIANGIPTNLIPPSATNFMNGVVAATYFNALDLGFGRRMIMQGTNGGDWAFAVANYHTLEDALNDTNKIATVTMDYSAVPPGTTRFTKFYVYGPNDMRSNSANLDGGGFKFVPGLCVACHGGTTGTVPPGGGDVHAHFLAFDLLNSLDYSSSSNLTRSAQEPAFKLMNQAVLAIEQDIALEDPTNFCPAITNLIQGWYGPGLANDTANDNFVPSQWQDANSTSVLSLAGQAFLYRNVVAPSCRSCHETRADPLFRDFRSFTNFNYWAAGGVNSVIKFDVFGTYNLTQPPVVLDPNNFTAIAMPQARRTFQRFWDSISPRPEPEILSDFLAGVLDSTDLPSAPQITDVGQIGSDLVISFTTSVGGSYSLESADDLTQPVWTPVGGAIAGTGAVVQIIEPKALGQSKGFYRVAVETP
jgi:hypothetical protein